MTSASMSPGDGNHKLWGRSKVVQDWKLLTQYFGTEKERKMSPFHPSQKEKEKKKKVFYQFFSQWNREKGLWCNLILSSCSTSDRGRTWYRRPTELRTRYVFCHLILTVMGAGRAKLPSKTTERAWQDDKDPRTIKELLKKVLKLNTLAVTMAAVVVLTVLVNRLEWIRALQCIHSIHCRKMLLKSNHLFGTVVKVYWFRIFSMFICRKQIWRGLQSSSMEWSELSKLSHRHGPNSEPKGGGYEKYQAYLQSIKTQKLVAPGEITAKNQWKDLYFW